MIDEAAVEENRGYKLLMEALGPVGDILERDDVVEIYCNSNCLNVWIEYVGRGRVKSDIMLDAGARTNIINIVASYCCTIANTENPIISAELPKYGYRFESSIPEISILPSFNIRKPAMVVFSLDDYVKQGIMSEQQKDIIQLAVRKKLNILVGGGTGSGKTTLANAILGEIAKTGDRLVIIEDTRELQCEADDYEAFRTSMTVNATMLLRTTMRRRPDRIVVGEVRDGAAYDLLKAWNTGHPGGVSTTHANNALESLRRLESLSLEAAGAPPVNVINDLIGSTVKLVVFITRAAKVVDGVTVKTRVIKQVVYVKDYDFEKKTYNLIGEPDEILKILNAIV